MGRRKIFQVWGGKIASYLMMARHQDNKVLSCRCLFIGKKKKKERKISYTFLYREKPKTKQEANNCHIYSEVDCWKRNGRRSGQ